MRNLRPEVLQSIGFLFVPPPPKAVVQFSSPPLPSYRTLQRLLRPVGAIEAEGNRESPATREAIADIRDAKSARPASLIPVRINLQRGAPHDPQ